MNGIRSRLSPLGRELSPTLLQETLAFFGARHHDFSDPVERDLRYGSDERHRLDVFAPRQRDGAAPVLVFVHGGGFVRGDKRTPGTPFYDNVGHWAASRGWVGVTMTYRLAPQHTWPSGAEDVRLAVDWIVEHIAGYGGDPGRVFVMGQSAGAVHVASYVAFESIHGPGGPAVAGALLISGLYDIGSTDANEYQRAYFGSDRSLYAQCSSLGGLMRTRVPLLFSVSELDPDDFQRQAALVVESSAKTLGRYPRMLYLADHNHLSSVLQLALPDDTLGPEIERFVAAVSAGDLQVQE